MAYSTPAMVRKAVSPTSDGSEPDPAVQTPRTAADLSDTQLADAIAEADATIDSYIGSFYTVPVASVPDSQGNPTVPHPIDYWSRTLAAYNATSGLRGELDMDDANPVLRRYKDVMAALEAVSKGTLRLQIPDNTTSNSGTGAGAPYNPYVGDLWTPEDFVTPSSGYGGPYWPSSLRPEF